MKPWAIFFAARFSMRLFMPLDPGLSCILFPYILCQAYLIISGVLEFNRQFTKEREEFEQDSNWDAGFGVE